MNIKNNLIVFGSNNIQMPSEKKQQGSISDLRANILEEANRRIVPEYGNFEPISLNTLFEGKRIIVSIKPSTSENNPYLKELEIKTLSQTPGYTDAVSRLFNCKTDLLKFIEDKGASGKMEDCQTSLGKMLLSLFKKRC